MRRKAWGTSEVSSSPLRHGIVEVEYDARKNRFVELASGAQPARQAQARGAGEHDVRLLGASGHHPTIPPHQFGTVKCRRMHEMPVYRLAFLAAFPRQ